jgi:hypothetical protein
MIGSDFLDATATVFFVRLPFPFRAGAAGRAVITLDRIQFPPSSECYDSTDPPFELSM